MWRSLSTGDRLFKLKTFSLISVGIYSLSTRERRKTLGLSTIAITEIFEDLKWRWKGYPDVWIASKREERAKLREEWRKYEIDMRKWRAGEEKRMREEEEARMRREEEEEKKRGKNKGEESEEEEWEEWEELEELKKMDILREGWWDSRKK
jgi:hypothetical protein